MKYKFSDLVDIIKIQDLLESLSSVTGLSFGLHDTDGNLLLAVGWNEVCSNFYRINDETKLLCKQSDDYLINHLSYSVPYIFHRCKNGFLDAAAPILIDKEHLATIFHGQFLFEVQDLKLVLHHVKRYGFAEQEYIQALNKVPIYSKQKLDNVMHLIRQLAEMIGEMGLAQLQLIEAKSKALEESEKRLQAIINNAPNVAIQCYDEFGKLLFANKASEKLFGYSNSEAIGKGLDQLFFNQEVINKFLEVSKKIQETDMPHETIEWNFKDRVGIEKSMYSILLPVDLHEGKKEFIAMVIDITEKKRLEQEMYRIDQLNLVGQMAAGLAHEIRNPMTTVRGYLQLLQSRKELLIYRSQFDLMLDEIDRCNSIITEFLALSKTKLTATEMHSMNDIIAKLFPLIQADAFTKNMDILFEPGNIQPILLNPKEISQLILNLCRNGLEAMQVGGRLTLKTFEDASDLILSVKDEGIGIPTEYITMIGKPFFSTKDSGTGLGLAVCYNIATRHNAKIDINTSSKGSSFVVRFRRMTEQTQSGVFKGMQ